MSNSPREIEGSGVGPFDTAKYSGVSTGQVECKYQPSGPQYFFSSLELLKKGKEKND